LYTDSDFLLRAIYYKKVSPKFSSSNSNSIHVSPSMKQTTGEKLQHKKIKENNNKRKCNNFIKQEGPKGPRSLT